MVRVERSERILINIPKDDFLHLLRSYVSELPQEELTIESINGMSIQTIGCAGEIAYVEVSLLKHIKLSDEHRPTE